MSYINALISIPLGMSMEFFGQTQPSVLTGLFWADPTIGIDWPIRNPVLSDKDSKNPQLKEIPEALLPVFHPA